jgi:hypothetical protein
MFFRRKQSTDEWYETVGYKLQYEQRVESLYRYGLTTLAIARIWYWEGYKVKGGLSDQPMPSGVDFMMTGVVDERGVTRGSGARCDLTKRNRPRGLLAAAWNTSRMIANNMTSMIPENIRSSLVKSSP